jgi:hypothetical protein
MGVSADNSVYWIESVENWGYLSRNQWADCLENVGSLTSHNHMDLLGLVQGFLLFVGLMKNEAVVLGTGHKLYEVYHLVK